MGEDLLAEVEGLLILPLQNVHRTHSTRPLFLTDRGHSLTLGVEDLLSQLVEQLLGLLEENIKVVGSSNIGVDILTSFLEMVEPWIEDGSARSLVFIEHMLLQIPHLFEEMWVLVASHLCGLPHRCCRSVEGLLHVCSSC